MAAIVKRERRKLARLVRRKVLARKDSSERANVVDDRRPEITPIERLCAIAGDRLEGARQLRLHETLGRLESGRRPIGRATFAVVHALRLRILVQPGRERPEDERAVPIDEETLSGETDRRFEEASPGQLAEAAVSELVCRDGARHAHRQGALGIGVVFDRGPSVHAGSRIATPELEHVLARREWRASRAIERARLPVAPDHKSRDAAEPAPDRRGDAEGEGRRQRGVERIPALAQYFDARLRGKRVGSDHAAGRGGLGLGEKPLAPRAHFDFL